MKQKIYINARYLLQSPTGVERYAYEMSRALMREGAEVTFLCPKNGNIHSSYDVSDFNIIRYGMGSSHLWEQLVLPFYFIGKKNYIVVSFTGLGSILIPNKAMTIHDLSFLEEPSWFSRAYYYYYKLMTPLAVRSSRFIITVSEFSKREICRFYKFVKPESIHVIYNAVDRETFKPTTQHSTSTTCNPYILSVSSMDPRKNFPRLIEAFKGIEGCDLNIVGGVNKVFASSLVGSEGCPNIHFLGRVDNEQLISLYANSLAFVFPSLYEGFGLPPIEAMSTNTLVIASNIPVLKEVCKDAAIYFNPEDINDIRNAISKAISLSPAEREDFIRKGHTNLARFSWSNSAKRLIEILNGK